MQDAEYLQTVLDFHQYPSVGDEDWRYAFAVAEVRALQTQMLSRAMLLDMSNSIDFESALDMLASTEYALAQGNRSFAELESLLLFRRSQTRSLFADLIIDNRFAEFFKLRDDFANMRLAIRRTLTGKPIGTDYSKEGNISPELFEEAFEEENHSLFPEYMAEAVEQAVLAYYQEKDIRRIDYAIDSVQAKFNLKKARELKSVFLLGLFRIQIDLTNIRTMFRVRFTQSDPRNVFLIGGYIEPERFRNNLDIGYEAIGQSFFATPYYEIIQTGANYLASNKSFLKLEQQCEEHLTGFLKAAIQITAGPQPVIAYLLRKENEIRTVRLILTAKKNLLDTKLILDRIS